MHGGFIYLLTNKHHTVLYTGVTVDLARRIREHRLKLYPDSFTARYDVYKLVYYEVFDHIESAIYREKQIKKHSRAWKEGLINMVNPEWNDLFDVEVSKW